MCVSRRMKYTNICRCLSSFSKQKFRSPNLMTVWTSTTCVAVAIILNQPIHLFKTSLFAVEVRKSAKQSMAQTLRDGLSARLLREAKSSVVFLCWRYWLRVFVSCSDAGCVLPPTHWGGMTQIRIEPSERRKSNVTHLDQDQHYLRK